MALVGEQALTLNMVVRRTFWVLEDDGCTANAGRKRALTDFCLSCKDSSEISDAVSESTEEPQLGTCTPSSTDDTEFQSVAHADDGSRLFMYAGFVTVPDQSPWVSSPWPGASAYKENRRDCIDGDWCPGLAASSPSNGDSPQLVSNSALPKYSSPKKMKKHPTVITTRDQAPDDEVAIHEHWTTLMMKNIPLKFTGAMVAELLNAHGFAGAFDFVYAPRHFGSEDGAGYGFVNMINHGEAIRLRRQFNGFMSSEASTKLAFEIRWSGGSQQGLEANIARYQNSPLMHETIPEEYQPMYFVDGIAAPFPSPTKKIRAPRLRPQNMRQRTYAPKPFSGSCVS